MPNWLDPAWSVEEEPFVRQNKALSVAGLLRKVKSELTRTWGNITVEGEIHSIKAYPSGHVYFDLKDADEDALISCVLFRRDAARLTFSPKVGDRVEIKGGLNIYEPRGQLNFIAREMTPAGAGALYARFLALKEKLSAEGLFDDSRKKALPAYPRTIGVVTSSEGAAFRDVIKTVRNHAPWVNIILYPTSVQGAQAEGEILAALNAADTRQEVDVLLLVRGGGSLADLWSFNLESVARRIARMTIPVITGVGHETDFTIADFVSDWRAATPTAAAVKAVTLFSQVPSQLQDFERRAHKVVANVLNMAQTRLRQADRMDFAVKTGVRHAQMRVDDVVRRNANAMDFRLQQAKSRFAKADRMDYTVRSMLQQARVRLDAVADIGKIIQNRIDTCQQRVDMSQGALGEAALRGLETRLARLAVLDAQVKKPDFDKDRLAVESLQNTLKRLVSGDVAIRREKLKGLQKRLSGMDVNRVMQRGFSLVTDEKGKLVRDVKNLKSGDALTVRFAKGSAVSRVENVTAE